MYILAFKVRVKLPRWHLSISFDLNGKFGACFGSQDDTKVHILAPKRALECKF